ncbi:MAG: beta-ketoacyl-[acyl-carrier-protein] synthase family protein [Bythopirellula sp.]|nr:beta-ketoacyl-[acyl-carrier-protein] synthase family protein [Bythopirellula sp.]
MIRSASLNFDGDDQRIVITGVGLTAPNGDNLTDFRAALLAGRSGVDRYHIRYVGDTLAGQCHFDELKYQKRKELRRGTRAGSVSIYCANEAVANSGIEWDKINRERVGVYIGVTEHGNVETENEINEIKAFNYDTKVWSHHHNPRTVANNPAGEITLNMGITGPHYTIGAACAAGNAGLIQGAQMLLLDECDFAIAGGVSESIHTFGIFAGFASQGALAANEDPTQASRPFDRDRNGIVVSEGGCLFTLERYSAAAKRGAKIYGELVGHAMTSDASDFVLPNPEQQSRCMNLALQRARLNAEDIDIVSTHATATTSGDIQECTALRTVFGKSKRTLINNTKSFIGHAMGAAGSLELAGNLPSFEDGLCHHTINVDNLDPECELPGLVLGEPRNKQEVNYILSNSFGMLGINSAVVIKKI